MKQPGRAAVVLAAALLAVAAPAVAAPPVTTAPSDADPVQLQLVSQSFNVAPAGVLDVVVDVPSSLPIATLAGADIVVTAYNRVATRGEVQAAIAGDLPRSVDAVDVPIDDVDHPGPTQLHLTIPLETNTRTRAALQLSRAGLYPLVVDIRLNGVVAADVTSFANLAPASTDGSAPAAPITGTESLPIALAMGANVPVRYDNNGAIVLDAAAIAQLQALADALDASVLPATVRIPAGVVNALRQHDAALADRLAAALAKNQVVSAPLPPLDPSAAADASQQALYTQWLTAGEDELAEEASVAPVRTVGFASSTLTEPGASLLRDLGTRIVVMSPEVYDATSGTLGGFTDSSQLVQAAIGDSTTMRVAIVDRSIAATMSVASTDPALSAIYTVADLLSARQQVADEGGNPSRHGIVLGTDDLGIPDLSTLGPITALIAGTPGLTPSTVDDIGVHTDLLLNDGDEVVVRLPPTSNVDISARVNLTTALGLETASTISMLPADDARPLRWSKQIAVLTSNAMSDDQVAAVAASLRAEYASIRGAIEAPTPFAFTLTGRNSPIRVRLRNNASEPMKVRLRLTAAKLTFPLGDQTVTLAPNAVTEIEVRVEARSNGRFPVSLEVFTPLGDVHLAPPVPLTATVNALSGLGNLVTGAALLVLLTWWGRHVRTVRRRRRTASAAERHPVGAPSTLPAS